MVTPPPGSILTIEIRYRYKTNPRDKQKLPSREYGYSLVSAAALTIRY